MDSALAGGIVTVAFLATLVVAVRMVPARRAVRVLPAWERRASLAARYFGVARGPGLSSQDMRGLEALRRRMPELLGEALGPLTIGRRWAVARRKGVVPWALASGAGAFSMATHVIILWLGLGGGWIGAAVLTAISTLVMTGICLALVFRLGSRE